MKRLLALKNQLQAMIATLALIVSTTLVFIPILFIGLIKLIPNLRMQSLAATLVDKIAVYWCGFNKFYIDKTQKITWDIKGLKNLNPKGWYLVMANHQSWLDIVVLQTVFNKKIPALKFFIKDVLKWVPLLGYAWWAMGCPFMKRYSKEYLAKNPHKKGKDLIATHKAIEIFKRHPATLLNFIEGTRFTDEKKKAQQSPYQHLLKPRAGGVAYVLSAMGDKIKYILDVTIIYPDKQHSLWDFLCNRMHKIIVNVREIPIPSEFFKLNLINDEALQEQFKTWINTQWAEKDKLMSAFPSPPHP